MQIISIGLETTVMYMEENGIMEKIFQREKKTKEKLISTIIVPILT